MTYRYLAPVLILASVSGCGPGPSPARLAAAATPRAPEARPGTIICVRKVTMAALPNMSAGGITSFRAAARPVGFASLVIAVGGLGATPDIFEYIVRELGGNLVSVTQRDKAPLGFGQKVLVIAGAQAHVVQR